MSTSPWTLDRSRLEHVACPLCLGLEFERLAATDRYDMGIVTVGCLGCGLVMTNPQPTSEAIEDFYSRHYRRYYRQSVAPTLSYIRALRIDERTSAAVDFLIERGELRPGMAVLDIGASEGSMLRAVGDRMPTTRRFAIEPAAALGDFAVQHAGCEMHTSLCEFRDSQPEPVDLVIMNHVLEHIKNPVQFLLSMKPLLAPNARVYIDVPDLREYRKLSALHIAHLYHFGPETLAHTAARAGYTVHLIEKHAPPKHPRSLRCVLSPTVPTTLPEPVNQRTGWQVIRSCAHHAWYAHGKRWIRRTAAPLLVFGRSQHRAR
ncbi:MAG: class I SAM-dependent methyltransferase [Burkholderiaceae bacterium]|nr:class I SAM-dependent methyltransferase [Burkholderiaceae bacterium]